MACCINHVFILIQSTIVNYFGFIFRNIKYTINKQGSKLKIAK